MGRIVGIYDSMGVEPEIPEPLGYLIEATEKLARQKTEPGCLPPADSQFSRSPPGQTEINKTAGDGHATDGVRDPIPPPKLTVEVLKVPQSIEPDGSHNQKDCDHR